MSVSLRGKAFFEKLEAVHGLRVCSYLREVHVQSIDSLISWLMRYAQEHFEGRLSRYPGEVYPYLLRFVHTHAPNRYEPESFRCEGVPVEAWVTCANEYGTVGKLSMMLRDSPHMVPRKDAYIAFRIGLMSAEELQLLPPKIHTYAVRGRRRRR